MFQIIKVSNASAIASGSWVGANTKKNLAAAAPKSGIGKANANCMDVTT
mgnify:CR=1 FL=1